jgi:hypothetical protein
MSRFLPAVAALLLAGVAGAACSTRGTAQLASRQELAQPVSGPDAERLGQVALQWGDAWTATNLFRRAADADATANNRFNLATGYERTGRAPEAQAIYREIVASGTSARGVAVADNIDRAAFLSGFGLVEESARRLDRLALAPYQTFPFNQGGGVYRLLTAGEQVAPGDVSDATALRLDRAAQARDIP